MVRLGKVEASCRAFLEEMSQDPLLGHARSRRRSHETQNAVH